MKMSSKDTQKWVIGAVVVIVIAGGIWWFMSQQSSTQAPAVTSSEISGAGQVTVQNSSGTVAQVIASIANGDRFAGLLSQTGVGATLSGKGPYTVFVSTDGAFGRLVPGTVNNLGASELKRLVQYHVVVGKKLDVDATQSGQIQALSKDMLNFQVDATKGAVYVNSGYVLSAYNASNGIVYVINSVLLPPVPINQ